MKDIIFTEKATAPTAPYSQAIRAGSTVYLAGVCGDDPATGKLMGSGDMTVEAAYAMENLKNTLEAAGGPMEDIVKVQGYYKASCLQCGLSALFSGGPSARPDRHGDLPSGRRGKSGTGRHCRSGLTTFPTRAASAQGRGRLFPGLLPRQERSILIFRDRHRAARRQCATGGSTCIH